MMLKKYRIMLIKVIIIVFNWLFTFYFYNSSVLADSNPDSVFVSAGNEVTCELRDRKLKCYGSGSDGLNNLDDIQNVDRIGTVSHHFCATIENKIKCWGHNLYGQSSPPDLKEPISIVAGAFHTCALAQKNVTCWGGTNQSSFMDRDSELDVRHVPKLQNPFYISAGANQACAIDDTGATCWGSVYDWEKNIRLKPRIIPLAEPKIIIPSEFMICALDKRGIGCWDPASLTPINLPSLKNPKSFDLNNSTACAIDDTGVVCWNNKGSHGPVIDNIPALEDPSQISVGYNHACAVDKTGVHCWGNGKNGETGEIGDYFSLKDASQLNQNKILELKKNNIEISSTESEKIIDYCEQRNETGEKHLVLYLLDMAASNSNYYTLKIQFYLSQSGKYNKTEYQFIEKNLYDRFEGNKIKRDELRCLNQTDLDRFVKKTKKMFKTKHYNENKMGGVCLKQKNISSHWVCLGFHGNEILAAEEPISYLYGEQLHQRYNMFYEQWLPDSVVDYLKSKYQKYNKITACSVDFNSDKVDDYLVGIVEPGNSTGTVLGLIMNDDKIKNIVTLFSDLKLEGSTDYWELYCDQKKIKDYAHGIYNPVKNGNVVVSVKNSEMNGLNFYVLEKKYSKFKLIGGVSPD